MADSTPPRVSLSVLDTPSSSSSGAAAGASSSSPSIPSPRHVRASSLSPSLASSLARPHPSTPGRNQGHARTMTSFDARSPPYSSSSSSAGRAESFLLSPPPPPAAGVVSASAPGSAFTSPSAAAAASSSEEDPRSVSFDLSEHQRASALATSRRTPSPQPLRSSRLVSPPSHSRSKSAITSPTSSDGRRLPLSPSSRAGSSVGVASPSHERHASMGLFAPSAAPLSSFFLASPAGVAAAARRKQQQEERAAAATQAGAAANVSASPKPVPPATASALGSPPFASRAATTSRSQPSSRRVSRGSMPAMHATSAAPAAAAAARATPTHSRSPSARATWGGLASPSPTPTPPPRMASPMQQRSSAPSPSPHARDSSSANLAPVQVFCRFRPCFEDELASGDTRDLIAIAADSRSVQVAVDVFADGKATDSGASGPSAAARRERGNMTEFQFQHVFQPHTTQAQVYDRIVEHGAANGGSILDQLFRGINCTVMAYGQTGTGKSWSMEGPSSAMLAAMSPASVAAASLSALDSDEPESESAYSLRGLIPRLVEAIFRRLQEQHQAAAAAVSQDASQASHAPGDDSSSIPVSPALDASRPSSAPASLGSGSGSSGSEMDVSVQISFFELYRGKIRDLLAGGKSVYEVEDSADPAAPGASPLAPIGSPLGSPMSASSAGAPGSSPPPPTARALQLQMKDKQVVVVGLSERSLRDSKSVLRALKEGQRHRTVARTNANAWSSRGHAIFDVSLRQTLRRRVVQEGQDRGDVASHTIVSRLRLVDLAGSEQHVESGVESARLEEARSINRSLTFLGKVITSLAQREKHISYRDALLTRLLSQSLGGNCTTTLLITASPARASLKKTLNTLRFGAGATSILNAVSVNSRRRPGSVAMNYAIPALPLSALDEWEEGQCWSRLQTVQKRDGVLKCVPLEWVRTLLPRAEKKDRRNSGAGLTPGSPAAQPSKENIEAVHALSSEVESLRKSLGSASSQCKLAEGARASALATTALTAARLRDLEVNARALLGLLNKIGLIKAAQRVQAIHEAATPGSNLLSAPVDSVQSMVDELLAAGSEKDAAGAAGLSKQPTLKALKKLIQYFPVDCSVDAISAGARTPKSPSASPTRSSRSTSSTRASPGAAPRSASSTRAAPGTKAEDAATAERCKVLESKNAALESALTAAKRSAAKPKSATARDKSPAAAAAVVAAAKSGATSAEQAALQSELDASYREITRVNAENAALQDRIKALQLREKKQLKPSAATSAGTAVAPIIVATKLPALSSIEEQQHLFPEQKEQWNAQLEARVAQETAQLREQLAAAQEQAREASLTAAGASNASPAAHHPPPQQVNRQLFPSEAARAAAGAAAAAPADDATTAEIDSRVESLLAERTQQLQHDFAQAQAQWMAAKESEWAALQDTFQADVQAQQMQMQQHAQELQQQADEVLQQKQQLQRSVDLDRTLQAAMQDPNATARSPSNASFSRSAAGLASPGAEDTAELAAALSDQVAAEKSAFIIDLRARIAEEQRLWAGALTSEHGALLRREIGEEAASFDARFRHLEFALNARVDSITQEASRKVHEHHVALQNKERKLRDKIEHEVETRKLEWQQVAVQNYQQQQREEQALRSEASQQRDPDCSPLSPTRGATVDPTLPLRDMEQQTSVRLALLELEKVDLEARERQVREWKQAVETLEAKQRAYGAKQPLVASSNDEQDQADLVRKLQADTAALLESERAAHAAELEAQRQSSAAELDSLLSARLAAELERLRERFSLEKLDWMDRSKRNLDATVAAQVAEERTRIEARLSQAVQERVVVELERSKAALKIEQASKWDAALREQTAVQTAQHQSQIDALSLQLASLHDRWEERERSFSRMLADQGSKAKEEVRRTHATYQQREAEARARAESELSAVRAAVDAAQIRADDSKALALQVEYLSREQEFQAHYRSFVQQQLVEPLTKENQALKDQVQMMTLIQQQTQHEQRFSPAAVAPTQPQQQRWPASAHQGSHTTRKRLDYAEEDEDEEKQQPPPTPSPRIFVASSGASISSPAPAAATSRAVTTPNKHEVERREIKAQIAQLEDQLLQVKSPPPASAASARKRSPRAPAAAAAAAAVSSKGDSSSGLVSPSRQTLRVDSSPAAVVAHLESADRSDYPFGSSAVKSMQLVDRLHVHHAAEQARQHLEAADAELNQSSLASAATAPAGSDAASPSPAASLSSSSFRPQASAPAPSFIPAALDISLLEADLYTQHHSYLASQLDGGVREETSELEQRNARESQKMEQELIRASAMMREALEPTPSAPAAPPQSELARQQDEQLAQMQAELRQTQQAIQQLVAAAAASKAPQLVEAEQPPLAAATAAPASYPTAASPTATAVAPDLPADVRALISGLQSELGQTNKLLQSERTSRLAAAADASAQKQAEEEDRKLDATLSAHALIHSVPTPPLSPIAAGASPWAAGPAAPSAAPSSAASATHAMYRASTIQPSPFRSSVGSDFAATIARVDAPFHSAELATPTVAAASPSSLDDSFTARSEELRAAEKRTEEARRRVQSAVHAARTSHRDGTMKAPLLHVVPPPSAATHSFSSSRLTVPVAASTPSVVSARSHLQHLQLPYGAAIASSPRWSPPSDARRGIRR